MELSIQMRGLKHNLVLRLTRNFTKAR